MKKQLIEYVNNTLEGLEKTEKSLSDYERGYHNGMYEAFLCIKKDFENAEEKSEAKELIKIMELFLKKL